MKLLIIGNIYDNHNVRIVNNLIKADPKIDISFAYLPFLNKEIPNSYNSIKHLYCVRNNAPKCLYSIPVLRTLLFIIDRYICLKNMFSSGARYDYINVEYVSIYSLLESKYYHKLANKVLLTPWGSDVYRIPASLRPALKLVYDKADYISGEDGRFRDDFIQYFKIDKKKIASFDIGSDMIDIIAFNNVLISKQLAKDKLGLSDNFVIECGYNASPAQNHKEIINALLLIKEELPKNVHIILPMTYAGSNEYINDIENLIAKSGFSFTIYKKYLSDYELYLLRRCADIFVHVQTTDANSAAVREYLLTETKVINGAWLRYKEIEKYGVPYYINHGFETLGRDILNCINSSPIIMSKALKEQLLGYGWKIQAKKWIEFLHKNK